YKSPVDDEIITVSLHDALPIFALDAGPVAGDQRLLLLDVHCWLLRRCRCQRPDAPGVSPPVLPAAAPGSGSPAGRGRTASSCTRDRKSTRLNSSHVKTSYAVFC